MLFLSVLLSVGLFLWLLTPISYPEAKTASSGVLVWLLILAMLCALGYFWSIHAW